MITAKEANEMAKTSASKCAEKLELAEITIRKAAENGHYEAEVMGLDHQAQIDFVASELHKHGFCITRLSKSINVEWCNPRAVVG